MDEPLCNLDAKLRTATRHELTACTGGSAPLRLRHPRPGRGDDDGNPDRASERGPARTDRHPRARSTTAPRRCSSPASSAALPMNLLDATVARGPARRLDARRRRRPAVATAESPPRGRPRHPSRAPAPPSEPPTARPGYSRCRRLRGEPRQREIVYCAVGDHGVAAGVPPRASHVGQPMILVRPGRPVCTSSTPVTGRRLGMARRWRRALSRGIRWPVWPTPVLIAWVQYPSFLASAPPPPPAPSPGAPPMRNP